MEFKSKDVELNTLILKSATKEYTSGNLDICSSLSGDIFSLLASTFKTLEK